MNAPSVDIVSMLEAESALALTFGTDLFIGLEPSAKGASDNCVTVFDTPGGPPQLTLAGDENYYYPSVQIRVRNNDYLTGWNLLYDIMVALHGRAQETCGTTLYSVIQAAGDPAFLDWDANNRARFICNFNIQRR